MYKGILKLAYIYITLLFNSQYQRLQLYNKQEIYRPQMRDRRGSLVINLIETPNGFSIVEGSELLNKVATSVQKQAQTAQTSSILNAVTSSNSVPTQLKQQKSVYQTTLEINLVFPKNPKTSISSLKRDECMEDQDMNSQINNKLRKNSEACKATQWFSMKEIHQNQKNQIRIWYAQEHPQQTLGKIQQSKQFSMYLNRYKKHRNTIVVLYYTQYFPKQAYLPASQIRKRIPYDAYWLMKIHIFLSNNFIINCNTTNFNNQIVGLNQYLYKFNLQSEKFELLDYEYHLALEGQNAFGKLQLKQKQNYTLKLITQKIRPFCDYCGIHCGIVWFHHFKQIDPKEITMIMKNVNSKNPPLSEKPYEMTLCTHCYCDGNFPLLLTHHDFKKTTVNDKLQPNKKKKLKKKKKDKKKKRKQREREQEKLQKQDEQQIFQQNQDKQYDLNGKIIEYKQENQNFIEEEQGFEKNEEQLKIQNNIHVIEQQNVTSMIQTILNSLQKQKKWNLGQTLRLLQLVQKHGQDWQLIKDTLNEQNLCVQCTIQDILNYFVSLPRRRISKLRQQYQPQQFLLQNYKTNRNSVSDVIAQRTLNRCIMLSQRIKYSVISQDKQQWKQRLNTYLKLEQQKLMNRIQQLKTKQDLAVQTMRRIRRVKI